MEDLQGRLTGRPKSNTILVVDDDVINRRILGKLFSEYYTVIEAEDGRAGLEKILSRQEELCAVLLDVQMPEMDGIEVVRRMQARKLLDKIPVFLITAESGQAVVREAYELGVMDVIRKPVISYVVLRRVRSVIELFEARKHLNDVVESQNIALASIMHDVGKITIPDAVLTKPGRLTPEEYEVMKSHTVKGVTILESIPQLRSSGIFDYACDIARHHHERWDGNGYPDHLAGDQISPWAQVVSLADVYDALSCKRVYKASFPRDRVIEMITTGQCGLFNPHLLESFLSAEDRLYELYRNLPEAQNI